MAPMDDFLSVRTICVLKLCFSVRGCSITPKDLNLCGDPYGLSPCSSCNFLNPKFCQPRHAALLSENSMPARICFLYSPPVHLPRKDDVMLVIG